MCSFLFILDQQEPIEDTGDCMKGNGRGYTGNQIYTKSKKQCQRWSIQVPQSHPMLPDIYRSELETAGQSCRNPGGLGSQPWCYTEDHNMRWEYCDIPKCGKYILNIYNVKYTALDTRYATFGFGFQS